MADQQELIIQIQAQLGDTLAQLKAVQDQINNLGTAGKNATTPVTGVGKTFGAVLGGVITTALAKISRKLIQFGKDAVDAFTKSDAAAKEFANTLEQRGLSQINAQLAVGVVEQMSVPAGFDPGEIQQAMSNVIVKMHNGANAVSAFQSAMDNARIKGISLATSVQSVTIAAEGSLKSLRQFGITTNKDVNGNLKTEVQLLKEISENTRGGLTTYMNTPLGMIDRMKVSLQQLKEAIGQGLTSVFAPVASATFGFSSALVAAIGSINVSIPAFNQLAIMGARIGQVFFNVGMVIRSVCDIVGTWAAALAAMATGNFKGAIDVMKENIKTLWDDAVAGNKAVNEAIKNIGSSTPESEVEKQMAELAKLLAGVQTGADGAAKSTEKWMAAFAPLKLLSGSIPNLAKYVGNLSSSFVLRSVLEININDNTKPAGNTVQQSVKTAVTSAVSTAASFYSGSTVASHGASLWGSLFNGGGGKAQMQH